jgi:hypothetical protein
MAKMAVAFEAGRRSDEGDAEAARIAQPKPLAAVELEAQVLVRLERSGRRIRRPARRRRERLSSGSRRAGAWTRTSSTRRPVSRGSRLRFRTSISGSSGTGAFCPLDKNSGMA